MCVAFGIKVFELFISCHCLTNNFSIHLFSAKKFRQCFSQLLLSYQSFLYPISQIIINILLIAFLKLLICPPSDNFKCNKLVFNLICQRVPRIIKCFALLQHLEDYHMCIISSVASVSALPPDIS